jgi:A/G-specific adenine glycosylase
MPTRPSRPATPLAPVDPVRLHQPVLAWYAAHARDLPWRRPGTSPWAVLVSEVMLQQTPVARVEPVYREWVDRWPTPAALAAEPAGEAVRAWGRLGYPRRALRLHAAAAEVVARHGGELPTTYDDLRALPGVGDYTAAAVASFAHGARHAVLDTNVRRVLARLVGGEAEAPPAVTAAERRRAEALLPGSDRGDPGGPGDPGDVGDPDHPENPDHPDDPGLAARWAVAVMELGALVCTARSPACPACPVADRCAWLLAGRPPSTGEQPRRRSPRFEGTDRQARGRLLAVVRSADAPVPVPALTPAWPERVQRERALAGLLHDGLVDETPDGYVLPGMTAYGRTT